MPRTKLPHELFCKPRPSETPHAATLEAIAHAESQLGITLPEAYTSLLRVRNGGRLRLNRFKLKKKPPEQSVARNAYHVPSLAGVGETVDDSLVQLTRLARDEWDVPDRLIAFCGDGHWWCCLDYRASGPRAEPAVTHIDTDDPPLEVPIAPSFAEFLAGLSRDPQSLTPALIALDAGAPRGEQLDAALKKLGFKAWKHPGISQRPPPPAWEWDKYRSFVKGCEARVELWTNRLYDVSERLTSQRSQKHPMLRLSVAPEHEEPCLSELLAALGPSAVLLHNLE